VRHKAAACLLLTLWFGLAAASEESAIQVRVNGKPLALKTPPLLRKGKPWVPVAEVSKKLGGHIRVIRPGKLIGLCVGKTKCVPLRVGAPDGALIVKGTAYAPAKVVAQALNAKFSWHRKTETLSFTKR